MSTNIPCRSREGPHQRVDASAPLPRARAHLGAFTSDVICLGWAGAGHVRWGPDDLA